MLILFFHKKSSFYDKINPNIPEGRIFGSKDKIRDAKIFFRHMKEM
jgi:hypothetical protein